MTGFGVDFSIECTGNVNVMRSAMLATKMAGGKSCIIGVAGAGQTVKAHNFDFLYGRSWTGSAFGGTRGRT
jgi:S-(hydroxymethyl)glutathione dehydrogenase/alcohol dehydrogenase